MTSVWKNLRWGIGLGLVYAAVFSAWIVILIVLNRSLTLHLHDGYPVNAFAVIASYLWGGVTAGAIVGLLRPLGRTLVGTVVITFIAAIPVFVGVRVALNGFAPWESEDTAVVLIASAMMSIFIGVPLWMKRNRKARGRWRAARKHSSGEADRHVTPRAER